MIYFFFYFKKNNQYRSSTNAKEVYICGSFDNWSKRHKMEKDDDLSCFITTFCIPNKRIYYKFVVDEVWQISEYDKTEVDSMGNVNNVIIFDETVVSNNTDHESDGASEFTSISYPNSDYIVPELDDKEYYGNPIEDDLQSSVQITIKDTSSVNCSIQSRNTTTGRENNVSSSIKITPLPNKSLIGRLRSIFNNS